jgi:hypothetical protein
MKRYVPIVISLIIVSVVFVAEPAFAGPGGKIASAVYESFWGRVLFVFLFIAFLPLIVLNSIKRNIAERRARKDLAFLTRHSDLFDWLTLQQRFKDSFARVHSGWQDENLADVSSWMSDWYWKNQQQVYLDKWKKAGLVNICDVKKIQNIRPILVSHKNNDNNHLDSKIVVSITAKMNDYLQNIETKKIVEGSKEYKAVTTIWIFTLEDNGWKVSGIEESASIMQFVKMQKNLPPIESTVGSSVL